MFFEVERSEFPKKIRVMALTASDTTNLINTMFGDAEQSTATQIEETGNDFTD